MPRARVMPSDLLRWIEAQTPGSIMRRETFERIRRAAYNRLMAKGVSDINGEATKRSYAQAGSAYWRAAVKKYFLATGKMPEKKKGGKRMKKNPVLAVMGNPAERKFFTTHGPRGEQISRHATIEAAERKAGRIVDRLKPGDEVTVKDRNGDVVSVTRKAGDNPPRAGEIFSLHVHAITYTHKGDGLDYKHEFAGGVHMRANRDGSITLYHPDKPIWRDFR